LLAALLCTTAGAVSSIAQRAELAPSGADVLVSRQLMEREGLSVGDTIRLAKSDDGANAHAFRIVGQYEPTPDPLRLGAARLEVRLHLPQLLEMVTNPANPIDAESVDAVNVALSQPDHVGDAARRLTAAVPGAVARGTGGDSQRAAPFVVLEQFHFAIAIVTVLASSVFLLALMLMLMEERRATVGVLRLIGFRRGRIFQHVLAEGVAIAVAGAAFGVLLSIAMQGAINAFFQWRYDTALVFVRVTPRVVLQSLAIAVPLGIAAITASSWTLLRSDVLTPSRR
jgi:putative ABC transport system permease protein